MFGRRPGFWGEFGPHIGLFAHLRMFPALEAVDPGRVRVAVSCSRDNHCPAAKFDR